MDLCKKTSGTVPTDKLQLATNACHRETIHHINTITTDSNVALYKAAGLFGKTVNIVSIISVRNVSMFIQPPPIPMSILTRKEAGPKDALT